MNRILLALALFSMLSLTAAMAQIALPWPGPGMPTTPPVTCGTGVIDLSTGCTQPMFGGL